jgi:bis(5'-nucleosidyl)-tetraphosphatase
MEQHVSAGVVIYAPQHPNRPEYLIIRHANGHWDLPKGHVDPGETHLQTALRELHEETGLTATIDTHFTYTTEYDFVTRDGKQAHKKVYWFVGKATSQNVVLSHEHTEFAWLSYERAVEQMTHATTKEVLQAANAYLLKHSYG